MQQAFIDVFPELIASSMRLLEVRGKRQTTRYALIETFCSDPTCNCDLALLMVTSPMTGEVVTVLRYDLRLPRDPRQAVFDIDEDERRDAEAHRIADAFGRMLREDPGYDGTLREHYRMMKAAARAAQGRKGKPKATTKPRPKAAATAERKKRATPAAPTGAAPSPAAAGGALARVKARAAGEGKVQKQFRRAIEKVNRLKERVRRWMEARPEIAREHAVSEAARGRYEVAAHAMVVRLDEQHGHAALSKADRKDVSALIGELARDLLDGGGHDELKAIYNRHTRGDYDAEATMGQAEKVEELKEMIAAMGVDLGDKDVRTVDELLSHAQEQLRDGPPPPPPPRRRSKKQQAADEAREEERLQAGKLVQELYRELARAHHPDREQDAKERVRKTELMKEVNAAYERTDLLRLLELQLELEQVDAAQVATFAEERLRRYCRILDEQAAQLERELTMLEGPFRAAQGGPWSRSLTPADVIADLRAELAEIEERTAALAADRESFRDIAALKAFLRDARGERTRERDETLRSLFG